MTEPTTNLETKDGGEYEMPVADTALRHEQSEVGYDAYAVRQNPARAVCGTCRYFIAKRTDDGAITGYSCAIVQDWPIEIVASGYCKLHSMRPTKPSEVAPEPMKVVIVEEVQQVTDSSGVVTESMGMEDKAIGRYGAKLTPAFKRELVSGSIKNLGDRLFYCSWTNAYEDLEQETIPRKAHAGFIRRAEAGLVPYPELQTYHVNGTRHGQLKWMALVGNTVVGVGQYDDTPAGRAAEKFYQSAAPGSLAMSHGFEFDYIDDNGVYHAINTREISTLPRGKEANPLTGFVSLKELSDMPLNDSQRTFIKQVFGDQADTILQNVESTKQWDDELTKAGFASKMFTDVTDAALETAVAQTETKAADKAELSDLYTLYADLVQDVAGLALNGAKSVRADLTLDQRLKRLEDALELKPLSITDSTKTLSPESEGTDLVALATGEMEEKRNVDGKRTFISVT